MIPSRKPLNNPPICAALLRFYNLGDKYKSKVEHIGAKPGFDVKETLIFQCGSDVIIKYDGIRTRKNRQIVLIRYTSGMTISGKEVDLKDLLKSMAKGNRKL